MVVTPSGAQLYRGVGASTSSDGLPSLVLKGQRSESHQLLSVRRLSRYYLNLNLNIYIYIFFLTNNNKYIDDN